EKGVPRVTEWIETILPEGGTLGFDGRVVTGATGRTLEKIAEKKHGKVESGLDLVGDIWDDRPELPKEKAWILDLKYAGESVSDKLDRIRSSMRDDGADLHLLTSLDDIMWTLNLRGNDVKHCPVTLSYLSIGSEDACFYVQSEALTEEVRAYLNENGIGVKPYEAVYEDAKRWNEENHTVLLDPNKVNDLLMRLLSGTKRVEKTNPEILMKACKNPTELANIRRAHLEDGIAITKWIFWLKENAGKIPMTEISVSEKLAGFRASRPGFLDLSFETIAGYKEHGAIIHYCATEESDKEIRPESFLLVDSGGHYVYGSTDITRTIAMGPLTEEEKESFTLVLKCHLALLPLVFAEGCSGMNFDLLVREPLWERGLDYRHGTGHGVGYLLSVHEPPNGFRYKMVPERNDYALIKEGMVTTDEPGLYVEGKYGIRTESELACVRAEETEFGQFLKFENLTFCPIDLDAVVPSMLTEKEKETLNRYHEAVYEALSPYMTEKENEWLKKETRRIS
ncbi:MAG: aminopeptidase P family protein, partial [Lachnospiraceae bacterium]|nr:aminopeptidase P family protein [Lachnospiraceae bacterium]